MKYLFVVALFAALSGATITTQSAEWQRFKSTYGKSYGDTVEEETRAAIFALNMERAAELQKRNPLAAFGVTKFSDMTESEFRKHYLNAGKYFEKRGAMDLPVAEVDMKKACDKVDWRERGAVLPVRNQGNCGSCWAFASISNIESQWILAGNKPVELSEQMLVSCAPPPNKGCSGGDETAAFEWLLTFRKGEVVTRKAYPYIAETGRCSSDINKMEVGAVITGNMRLPEDEDQIAAHVCERGPIDLGVDAQLWMWYTGGILMECPNFAINHAVNIVGFDGTHDPPYWIIRNSWGQDWGEQGYIRIAKGTNACGVKQDAATSIVKKN